jgi:FkbM family methyltransferase
MAASGLRRYALREIRRRGIQVKRLPPSLIENADEVTLNLNLAHLLGALTWPNPGFFFVQVGAFNGRDALHDLVVRYDLAGIVVEPQASPFQALEATYADRPRVELRNVAVGDRDGQRRFYRLREGMPPWTQQLASFDEANILKHDALVPNLRDNIVSEMIDCVTFETLLTGRDRVDLLQVDAEGYDATLIGLFDFEHWRPSIVQFEHHHLSRSDHDAAIRRLLDRGYRVALSAGDTIACRDAS